MSVKSPAEQEFASPKGTIKVVISGINGRMGRASARALSQPNKMGGICLAGAFGKPDAPYVGKDIAEVASIEGTDKLGILVSNGFLDSLAGTVPDVLLDVSHAEAAVLNAKLALKHRVRPVIGTSGLSAKDVEELSTLAKENKLGAMIIPNFSVGAVLMMEFARQAA